MKKPTLKLNQTVVNAVVLVLILGLFVYLGAQLSQGFSGSVTTQRTQIITDVDYLHLRGYVFRNESVIERPYSGVCHYLVEDGQRVGKDQSFATYYSAESDASSIQAEISELSAQIALLKSKVATGGNVSDLAHIEEKLSASYYAYVDSVLGGGFRTADREGEALLGSLVNHSVITEGQEDIVANVIKPLEEQRDALLATLGVVLPSFIIILIIAALIGNLMKYAGVKAFLGGVRPCVVGLILATAITMLLSTAIGFSRIGKPLAVDVKAIIIFALLIAIAAISKLAFRKKISPIWMILISAGLGILTYSI